MEALLNLHEHIQKYRNSTRIKLQILQRTSKTLTFKYKEHSKQNNSDYPPRSQSSLKPSSKPLETPNDYKLVKLYKFIVEVLLGFRGLNLWSFTSL